MLHRPLGVSARRRLLYLHRLDPPDRGVDSAIAVQIENDLIVLGPGQMRVLRAVAVVTGLTTVVLSMVLNSWAFTSTLDSWFGHTVGILLPMWVLALTFMGHRLWQEPSSRSLAGGCYGLAGFALIVSMPHLAHGYEQRATGVVGVLVARSSDRPRPSVLQAAGHLPL